MSSNAPPPTACRRTYELAMTVPVKYNEDLLKWEADQAKGAREIFWARQRQSKAWSVPAQASKRAREMLWLKGGPPLTEALAEARADEKTPLILDTSRNLIDTFYSHRSASIVEAKKCVWWARSSME